jgi:hypothetical protein
MTLEQFKQIVIVMNDARIDGRMTRELHAIEMRRIDSALTAAGFSWWDLA